MHTSEYWHFVDGILYNYLTYILYMNNIGKRIQNRVCTYYGICFYFTYWVELNLKKREI